MKPLHRALLARVLTMTHVRSVAVKKLQLSKTQLKKVKLLYR
jgi:hypothetical protein